MNQHWRNMFIVFTFSLLILGSACAQNGQDEEAQPASGVEGQTLGAENQDARADQEAGAKALAEMHDASDKSVGVVQFMTNGEKVAISADLNNLEPGWHGFHLHQSATCDPEAHDGAFSSAEGHYDPDHGRGAEGHGHHAGDMPPLYVNEDGTAKANFSFDKFTVEQLLNDGVAVMIHADPDNLGHIPDRYQSENSDTPGPDEETMNTGDAGERISCGVLQETGVRN